MPVQYPTPAQLLDAADEMGLSLSPADVDSFLGLIRGNVDAYNVVDALPDALPEVRYPRTPGRFPTPEENPTGAWYVRTQVKGADAGPLAGQRIAVKDTMLLAGVPMMAGSSILEGYVPDMDATVITRVLDAGAVIVGKTHCEDFCISGSSHTGAKGLIHNPHRHGFSAGGSSSGAAVVIVNGEADLAFGGDQGGSIRIPAAWSGIVGHKPTHGLVPYTGILQFEVTIDHIGPMTRTVGDCALMMEAIAGPDGYDTRCAGAPPAGGYVAALSGGVQGLRIGLVREGFDRPESEAAVDAAVQEAARVLRGLGAVVTEISVPMHNAGPALWTAIAVEGVTRTLLFGDGYGISRADLYPTSLMDRLHGWQLRGNELSETTKVVGLLGTYVRKFHGGHFYGKASNLARRLVADYDAALAQCDVLLMPTTPMKATPLPARDAPREERVGHALAMVGNTCPTNVSGHPALSVPCGMVDGLPVGMMLIGRKFDDSRLLQVAQAYETASSAR